MEGPDESPEALLDAGDGGGIGTESPRPEATDPASTVLGRAALGAGRGMARLGEALGWDHDRVEEEIDHWLRRVEAERQSQTMSTDQEADEARVSAPEAPWAR